MIANMNLNLRIKAFNIITTIQKMITYEYDKL